MGRLTPAGWLVFGYIVIVALLALWLSGCATQPQRYYWVCEDGYVHSFIPCDSDSDCVRKNGGDGGPHPHYLDHDVTAFRGDSVTR